MFSQKEAKSFGTQFVFSLHLLLGLIAEEEGNDSPDGFLRSGITLEKAREAVRDIYPPNEKEWFEYSHHVPFSFGAKRVFEAAVEYSKSLGHKFVSPEHIFVALCKVDDGSAGRILFRY